ncbi:MAG: DNA polymerase III subunit beta [Clostridia bacterium]|nr:DNA polymerase III subunit beta [Clostridia bacterium]
MEIYCNKNLLEQAISKTQRAVMQRSSVPALTGLLLDAYDGELLITGYDLETGVTSKTEANIRIEGSAIIPAREFSDIVRSLPDDEVKITVDGSHASISCGMSEYSSLAAYDAEDFPALPEVTSEKTLFVPKKTLKDLIRRTSFAAAQTATTEREKILCGVKLDFDGETLSASALDRFRIALCRAKVRPQSPISFVVPAKALGELVRLVDDSEDEVEIILGRKHILMRDGDTTVVSRLIEGEFLNYENAIPKEPVLKVIVDTNELLMRVDGAGVLISDKRKSPIIMNFEYDTLNIKTATQTGRFESTIPIENSGQTMKIGFNGKLFSDALKACETEKVMIELTSPLMPGVIRPLEGDEFLHLILPIRLMEE